MFDIEVRWMANARNIQNVSWKQPWLNFLFPFYFFWKSRWFRDSHTRCKIFLDPTRRVELPHNIKDSIKSLKSDPQQRLDDNIFIIRDIWSIMFFLMKCFLSELLFQLFVIVKRS